MTRHIDSKIIRRPEVFIQRLVISFLMIEETGEA